MAKKQVSEYSGPVKPGEVSDRAQLSPTKAPTSKRLSNEAHREVASANSSFRTSEPSRIEEGRLVIGDGVVLKGNIECCKTLEISGEVEAEIDCDCLVINEGGTLKGSVNSKTAEIAGTLIGTAEVQDKVMIRSTGRFSGNLTYGGIRIEMGGLARGELEEITATPTPEANREMGSRYPHGTQPQQKFLEVGHVQQQTVKHNKSGVQN